MPLLIELNLQFLFDKVIVVHLSPENQVERLAQRDGIAIEEATTKIRSQLPIDEKLGFADFIIHNDGSLEETRRQVETVWSRLKEIQKQKTAGSESG